MASIMARSAAESAQRTSEASARERISSHGISRAPMRTPPISVTWLRMVMPNSPRMRLATPATATRAVVSRALQDVADVAVPVLHRPREVGVARAWPRHRLGGRTGRRLAHGHRLLPVFPVAILDGQRDGAA